MIETRAAARILVVVIIALSLIWIAGEVGYLTAGVEQYP